MSVFNKTLTRTSLSTLALSLLAGLSACSSKTPEEDSMGMDGPVGELEQVAEDTSQESIVVEDTTAPVARTVRSRAPKIASKPMQVGSFWMNAFYFVRDDAESWESISQKLYGRPDRAKLLADWNNAKVLGVGSVVYYNSPSRPDDSQNMKPFALDFGSQLEQVIVKKGDWMSTIAQDRYSQAMSWREIAALNPQIANPDRIEIGQTLYVQPVDVDTATVLNAIVAQANQLGQKAQNAPVEPEQATLNTSENTTENPVKIAKIPDPTESNTEESSSSSAGLFSGDLMLYLGVGILVGASLLYWLRKRSQAKLDSQNIAAFPGRSATGT